MINSRMLRKLECNGGSIFKVVLECEKGVLFVFVSELEAEEKKKMFIFHKFQVQKILSACCELNFDATDLPLS